MRALHVWLAVSAVCTLASAFSFTDGAGTQCDDLKVQWSGGTAPFQLILIPIFGSPRNISIPADAFSNGAGSFSTQLPFAKDQQYLLTMSDATGFGTGGYSPLRTVGASLGGSCDTKDPGVAFSFELNSALQQCRPFTFSGYANAIQPVTAIGIVPGGKAVILHPPAGSSFDWTVTAPSGTSLVFMMIDAAGRQGGASDVRSVGITDDTTCLTANPLTSTTSAASPSTTTAPPKSSSTSSRTPRSSSSTHPSSTAVPAQGGGISIAAIAGTVVGALVFLAAAVTLGLFFLRRSRFGSGGTGRQSHKMQSQVDLMESNPSYHPYRDNYTPGSSPFLGGGQYEPTPYPLSPPQQPQPPQPYGYGSQYEVHNSSGHNQPGYPQHGFTNQLQSPDAYNPYSPGQPPYGGFSQPPAPQTYGPAPLGVPPAAGAAAYGHRSGVPSVSNTEATSSAEQSNRQSMASTTLTAAQRKAAMAGESTYKPPSRFILHTDAEDDLPPPNEDGVVELPPQYSERRMPLVDTMNGSETTSLPYAAPPPGPHPS